MLVFAEAIDFFQQADISVVFKVSFARKKPRGDEFTAGLKRSLIFLVDF